MRQLWNGDKMKKIEEINQIVNSIEKVNTEIYLGNYGKAFIMTGEMLKEISEIMQDLIKYIPTLAECGIDIPIEVVMQQLNNLMQAYENKDSMMLWDTLNYEIKDTFEYYIEIVKEFEEQGIDI